MQPAMDPVRARARVVPDRSCDQGGPSRVSGRARRARFPWWRWIRVRRAPAAGAFPTHVSQGVGVGFLLRFNDTRNERTVMSDFIRPAPKPALVADPNARKDAEEPELDDEGEPGADENAAGFLKNTTLDASKG